MLHSRNVVHHDLKPDNIVCTLGNAPAAKIIDLELARVFSDDPNMKLTEFCGTRSHMPPEVFLKNSDGFKGPEIDLYALGKFDIGL